ncbi:MAG: tetratricopeptide repeat protein [Chitinivibrionia bacterium]|nr:tetratricopeptide repeat protein [Chitinivibrionia bacterium]
MKNFLLSYSALIIAFCVFKADCSGVISAYYSLYGNMHGRSLEFGGTLDNKLMLSADVSLIAKEWNLYLKIMEPLGGGFNFSYTLQPAKHFQLLPIGISAGYWTYNFGETEKGGLYETSSELFVGYFARMRIGGQKVWFDVSDRVLFGRTNYEKPEYNPELGNYLSHKKDFLAINNVYFGVTWTPSLADRKLVIKKELAAEIAMVEATADSALATVSEIKNAIKNIEKMQQKIVHDQIRINLALDAVSPTRIEESEIQLAYLTEAFHDLFSRVKSIQLLPIIANANLPATRPPGFTVSTAPLLFGGNEYALYSRALDSYRKGFYDESRDILSELVNLYPNGRYSDRAYFWMGESHILEKNYALAIPFYGKVFDFAESSKDDDAQYRIAFCYKLLEEQDKAFEEFTKLVQRYPASEFVPQANNEIREITLRRNGTFAAVESATQPDSSILAIQNAFLADIEPVIVPVFVPEQAESEQTESEESEQDETSSQILALKQPTKDKDFDKRQKSIVKFTKDLAKMEKMLEEVKQSAPATYGVANFSVELMKTLNRMQEQKSFDFDEILPFVLKATFMTLPPNTIPANAQINTDIAVKLFPFLTVDFNLSQNRAVSVINSALKSWNGKSIYDIKNEMASAPPAQKVKIAALLKYSTGVFGAAIPQLTVTIKASL